MPNPRPRARPRSSRSSRSSNSASGEGRHLRELFRRCYDVIRTIPRGAVATYGQVAELAGIPGGARIAAAALKMSSRQARLPWQRVIGKAGPRRGRIAIQDPVGAAVQRQLLAADGIDVGDAGFVALDRYGWLPTVSPASARKKSNPATTGSSRAASPRPRPRSASTRRASSSRR